MVAVLYRIVGDRAQAEELAGDTFLKSYLQPHPPDHYRNLSGWLYRTATRLALNSLRSLSRRRRYEPEAGERLARATRARRSAGRCPRRRAFAERAGRSRQDQASPRTGADAGRERLSYREVAAPLNIKKKSTSF
jgi:DNA-directed RNA polymerase specialized sigma24 family protein